MTHSQPNRNDQVEKFSIKNAQAKKNNGFFCPILFCFRRLRLNRNSIRATHFNEFIVFFFFTGQFDPIELMVTSTKTNKAKLVAQDF